MFEENPVKIWAHAQSRYQCVSPALIEELQTAFFRNQDFSKVSSDLDYETASLILAETLYADLAIKRFHKILLPEQINKDFLTHKSDFVLAAISELMLAIAEEARDDNNEEEYRNLLAISFALLETIANSPTASPMLWYEEIFWTLAETIEPFQPKKALNFLKRGLAHNLRYNNGDNALNFLQDIANWHIENEEYNRGLQIFASLLREKPDDIWIYNGLALTCTDNELEEIGVQAAQRGLELIKAKGDTEKLSSQLKQIIREVQKHKSPAQNAARIKPSVLKDLSEALNLDFDATTPRPVDILCRKLIPNIDSIPVKRPLTYLDLPLPDRSLILKELLEPLQEPEEIIEQIQTTGITQKQGVKIKKKKHKKH